MGTTVYDEHDLSVKVAVIAENIAEIRKDQKEQNEAQKAQCQDMKELRIELTRILDDHERRIRDGEIKRSELEANMKMTTGIFAGIQVIMAGFGAWLATITGK